MSLDAVRAEITSFLSTDTPEVLCITGDWGVGKTFGWNKFLEEENARGKIRLKRYAYVSLFGITSLDELKHSIFENTIPTDRISGGPSLATLRDSLETLESYGRRGVGVLKYIPKATDWINVSKVMPWFFLTVKEQIVCLDDLERAGRDLRIKDVLGLVSLLKEQRHCKVVILLNQNELREQKDFKKQLEKVVDAKLEFLPDPSEAAEIAVSGDTRYAGWLKEDCTKLRITNIRVIKKIERLCACLEPLLRNFDDLIVQQAVHTATLFGWAHYQRDGRAPAPELIRNFNRSRTSNPADGNNLKEWHSLLQAYSFLYVDELDIAVMDGIAAGHFNRDQVNAAARLQEARLNQQRLDNSFTEAWSLYHHSFTTSADEVLKRIDEAFRQAVETISPINLNGTVRLFKDLGKDEKARELIGYYVDHRRDGPELFDLERDSFGAEVTDPDVRKAFHQKLQSLKEKKDPKEILLKIAESKAHTHEDLMTLAALSAEDFIRIFKSTEGKSLHGIVNAALQFRRYTNPSSGNLASIAEKAIDALKLIGQESLINARRVRGYGVNVEPPEIQDGSH